MRSGKSGDPGHQRPHPILPTRPQDTLITDTSPQSPPRPQRVGVFQRTREPGAFRCFRKEILLLFSASFADSAVRLKHLSSYTQRPAFVKRFPASVVTTIGAGAHDLRVSHVADFLLTSGMGPSMRRRFPPPAGATESSEGGNTQPPEGPPAASLDLGAESYRLSALTADR